MVSKTCIKMVNCLVVSEALGDNLRFLEAAWQHMLVPAQHFHNSSINYLEKKAAILIKTLRVDEIMRKHKLYCNGY